MSVTPPNSNHCPAAYEVGKFYMVPCVRGQYFRVVADWPVIGPQHDDADIVGFDHQHYHIDYRFVPERLFKPLGYQQGAPLMTSVTINPGGLPKPVLRRRKMYRVPPSVSELLTRRASSWYFKLQDAYADCKLKPGMICPHRGLPLETCPRDADVVTCPGHGLRWHVKTGEMVRSGSDATEERR